MIKSFNSNTTRSSDVRTKTYKGQKGKTEEELVVLPKALDYLFEKELINKQNKHIHIMDTFGPSRNIHHLSSKFYARHEQHIPQNHTAYISFVCGNSFQHDTEANVYGCMPKTVNRSDLLRELNFINAPRERCCLTLYGEKLESDRANARPPFNGLRFILQ